MDLEGLQQVLRAMHDGTIQCVAVDTPVPSQFSHELLNANPYSFLDDADLQERRARAVTLRRTIPDSVLGEAGRLEPAAIQDVRKELWPDLRDEHELHDLLYSTVAIAAGSVYRRECRADSRHNPRSMRIGLRQPSLACVL